ncbi:exopolyphosphatase PRUNE1 [Manduca sexta]|uniref:DHHA2 domain-containing protein n=1 Tax=Manduca sexta TaxID=7130 RepID=A0A922CZQ6_MANSE|nr:exopolyphosphatase PRUNE1 [Manduca sexta]KAG6464674.1 hypothetical protein O3G_MSEX014663 [Manduca sexta]
MEQYLANTINKLNTKDYNELTLVLGNESCDLDSAVCAIVYAAFLDWQYNQIKCKVCTRTNRDPQFFKDDIFVPILNVDRQDYELKTEVAFCLRDNEINDDHLVFRDDHDLVQLTNATKTNVVLVDHHVLAAKDQFLSPYVTEIIDHRPLQEWSYNDDTRSTMEVVGSCSTLVAQRINNLCTLLSTEGAFFESHVICAKLLHSSIILDTVNFSKEVNKATPHDEEMILFLESLLKTEDCESFRKTQLDRLVAARSDVSRLSPAQLLRKDVKILKDVLVPSFPILVKDFLQRPGALDAVTEALGKRGCSLALLLGMDLEGGLRRDMAVYCPDDSTKGHKLTKFLQEWTSPSLKLLSEATSNCDYNQQLNLSASRKQYMPALNEFLNTQ